MLAGAVLLAAGAAVLVAMVATHPAANLVLLETSVRTDAAGNRYVTGVIRNDAGSAYARADLQIDLLRHDGRVVGTSVVSTTDLPAGDLWSFEARVPVDDAVRYRVQRLTCSPTPDSSEWAKRQSCFIPPGRDGPPYAGYLPPAPTEQHGHASGR